MTAEETEHIKNIGLVATGLALIAIPWMLVDITAHPTCSSVDFCNIMNAKPILLLPGIVVTALGGIRLFKGPTPEGVRETYQHAELNCPNCGSDDYWFRSRRGRLTVHRCLECGGEGVGPGGFDNITGGTGDDC